tara:strand:+ start:1004 stop:1294 length:291 start_codon:yes stop_codon:yes gene_type:complete
MDRKSFYLALLTIFVMMYLFAGIVNAKKMTTCRLAKQVLVNKQRVCVFIGANGTQYNEYVPYDAGPCPRDYQCPYRPNEKPFDLKSVVDSIKNQFK